MQGAERLTALARGTDLFNHGYFWEAHEAWEAPWQREPKGTPERLYLQGLIRLAATALKYRIEQPKGVIAHAGWCSEVFGRLERQHPDIADGGPEPAALASLAQRLAEGNEPWDGSWQGPNPCLSTILTMSGDPA